MSECVQTCVQDVDTSAWHTVRIAFEATNINLMVMVHDAGVVVPGTGHGVIMLTSDSNTPTASASSLVAVHTSARPFHTGSRFGCSVRMALYDLLLA